jgi:hypothetical protein
MMNIAPCGKRILAQCTIDPLPNGKWLAVVTECDVDAPRKRIYTIAAIDDNAAAKQALARFEEDFA